MRGLSGLRQRRDLSRLTRDICRIQEWANASGVQARMEHIEPGKRWEGVGVVRQIIIDPKEDPTVIRATISDGTGRILMVWEKPHLPSRLRPGTGLRVRGLAELGPRGDIFFLEPDFEIVDGPY
jgi:hypothetical protein